MILAAFQEENWPARIDDPLPGDDNRDGPERLRDTVKKLNRQKVRRIHFSCDGTGEGILWNYIKTKRPGAAFHLPKFATDFAF